MLFSSNIENSFFISSKFTFDVRVSGALIEKLFPCASARGDRLSMDDCRREDMSTAVAFSTLVFSSSFVKLTSISIMLLSFLIWVLLLEIHLLSPFSISIISLLALIMASGVLRS